MQSFYNIIARLVFLLPFFLLAMLTEFDAYHFEMYLEAGIVLQVITIFLFIVAGCFLAEFISSRVLRKLQGNLSKKVILSISSIYIWVLCGSFFVSVLITMYTPYAKWKAGVSGANRIIDQLDLQQFIRIQKDLDQSLKIAKESRNQKLIEYTIKKDAQIKEIASKLELK